MSRPAPGEVWWAKRSGEPWWPAVVLPREEVDGGGHSSQAGGGWRREGGVPMYRCVFLQHGRAWAWVAREAMARFTRQTWGPARAACYRINDHK